MRRWTYKYHMCTATLCTLLLSSCGIMNQQKGIHSSDRGGVDTQHQIMMISTLGKSDNAGAIQSFSINAHTLRAEHTATYMTPSPTYMALGKGSKALYVTNELSAQATITALSLDKSSGELKALNSSYTNGAEPTYVSVYNNKVVSANYRGSSISMMFANKDQTLGPVYWQVDLSIDEEAKPHAAVFSNNGKHLYVTDMAQDKVFYFDIHQTNPPLTISSDALDLPEGSGPRHIIFGSDSRHGYIVCELTPTVYVVSVDPKSGGLKIIQEISTQGRGGKGGAHIALSVDGKYLYTSHRLSGDGIVTFRVNPEDGKLTYVGHTPTGKHPRHFALSPDNRYLAVACRDSNVVEIYERNPETGALTKANLSITADRPVYVLWESFGR